MLNRKELGIPEIAFSIGLNRESTELTLKPRLTQIDLLKVRVNVEEARVRELVLRNQMHGHEFPETKPEVQRSRSEQLIGSALYTTAVLSGLSWSTRREFLRSSLTASVAFILAACTGQQETPTGLIAPPTPTLPPDYYPLPISDAEYQELSDGEKFFRLVNGIIPESWVDIPRERINEDLIIGKLLPELQTVVIPQICAAFSLSPEQTAQVLNHFHFTTTNEEMKSKLMKFGMTEDEAIQKTLSAIGTDLKNYQDANPDLSENIIINSYSAVNIWSESVDDNASRYPNTPSLSGAGYLYSNIVATIVETSAHEIIHLLAESTSTINESHLERVKQIYQIESAGGEKKPMTVSGVPLSDLQLVVFDGATIIYQEAGDETFYMLNGDLNEVFRAYLQNYTYEQIFSSAGVASKETVSLIWDNPTDATAILLLRNLHAELLINPRDFKSHYSTTNFLGLIDYYKAAGLERGYNLSDDDIFLIFRTLEIGRELTAESLQTSVYKLGDEHVVREAAWIEIKKILDAKQVLPVNDFWSRIIAESDERDSQPATGFRRLEAAILSKLPA